MTTITLKGNPIHTIGELPKLNTQAPSFTLTKGNLTETTLKDYAGKKVILNIFPSLDTATCATSVRQFNAKANTLENTQILCISADLPFAQNRFCTTENLENVIPLSTFRHPDFGKNYGLTITDGVLAGLLSRAIVVLNENGMVIHTEQVPEIADEPNYEAALSALRKAVLT